MEAVSLVVALSRPRSADRPKTLSLVSTDRRSGRNTKFGRYSFRLQENIPPAAKLCGSECCLFWRRNSVQMHDLPTSLWNAEPNHLGFICGAPNIYMQSLFFPKTPLYSCVEASTGGFEN